MSYLEPLCNFRRNPRTLELTASVVSAAVLCRQAAMMNPTNPAEKVREIIALPPAIEQKIERFMPMVKEQIESWNNFYDRQIFFDRVGSRAHEYFHVLVWSSDGTINEVETAREMLKQDDLNAEEKYRIACNHCLKEKRINFINFLLNRDLEGMSFRSWEHFLMKLPNKELVSLFYEDRRRINTPTILEYLMRFWMHADFVVAVWMRIRDWYSEDAFSGMIVEFFTCDMFDIHSTDHISLAVEIFNLAPYKLRHAVFEYYADENHFNMTDVRLDVAILSSIDANRRHRYWAENWIDMFMKYPTDCFVQMMDVCCKEKGTEEFKMQVMKMQDKWSSELYSTLFSGMRFSELDQFLKLLSSDTCRIMKTKRMILRKNFFEWISWFETDEFIFPPPNQLVDFIEGSFESIRSANEFKIEVLSSVNCLEACYKAAGSDMFDWLKDAVWMCSCNDDDFKLYKNKFLQLDVELAKSSKCDIPDVFKDPGWVSILKWSSD